MALLDEVKAIVGSAPDPDILPKLGCHGDDGLDLLVDFGVMRGRWGQDDSDSDRHAALQGWRDPVSETLATETACFMDTTTPWTVEKLLSSDAPTYLSAGSLLDFDTFLRAVVLCDRVFTIKSDWVATEGLNDRLGDAVFIALDVGERDDYHPRGVFSALCDLWIDVCIHLSNLVHSSDQSSNRPDVEALRSSWSEMLDTPFAVSEMYSHQINAQWQNSFPPFNIGQFAANGDAVHLFQRNLVPPDWAAFVGEHNVRSMFNSKIAQVVGLRYEGCAARLPIQRHLLNNALSASAAWADLLIVQKALKSRLEAVTQSYDLQLPVLSQVVLGRSTSVSDCWSVIADLRHSAAGFRRRRTELLKALDESLSEREELASLVRKEAVRWRDLRRSDMAAAIAGGVGSATTFGTVGGWAAGITLVASLAGALATRGVGSEIFRRLFRRDEWFVVEVSTVASGLLNARPKIESLWHPNANEMDLLERHLARFQGLTLG